MTEEQMIELIEETANMMRGMALDPRLPQDIKEAILWRVRMLDEATNRAINTDTAPWPEDEE